MRPDVTAACVLFSWGMTGAHPLTLPTMDTLWLWSLMTLMIAQVRILSVDTASTLDYVLCKDRRLQALLILMVVTVQR